MHGSLGDMRRAQPTPHPEPCPDAMAGPYVRGDVGTVDKHLAAYETVGPTQLQMYAAAALCGLPHAAEKAVASSDDVAAIEVRLRAVLDSLASARL